MTEPLVMGYLVEPETYAKLRTVLRRLYGDGSHITADQRRDLANYLDVVLREFAPIKEPPI